MSGGERVPLEEGRKIAYALIGRIEHVCQTVHLAGSIRRQKPDIGDIDLVCEPIILPSLDMFGEPIPGQEEDLLTAWLDDMVGLDLVSKRLDANGRASWGRNLKRATFGGLSVDIQSVTPDMCDNCSTKLRISNGRTDAARPNAPQPNTVQAELRRVRDVLREPQPEDVQQELRGETGVDEWQEGPLGYGIGANPLQGDVRQLRQGIPDGGLHRDENVQSDVRSATTEPREGDVLQERRAASAVEGRDQAEGRLRDGLCPGPSEPEEARRVRLRASARDGEETRSALGPMGTGPSSERGKGRQPSGEPGSGDPREAERLGQVPQLRASLSSPLTCKTCNSNRATHSSTWGMWFLIRTGPADFNKRIVTPRWQGGLLPPGMEVRDGFKLFRGGGRVETPTEMSVFEAYGLDYVEPEARK